MSKDDNVGQKYAERQMHNFLRGLRIEPALERAGRPKGLILSVSYMAMAAGLLCEKGSKIAKEDNLEELLRNQDEKLFGLMILLGSSDALIEKSLDARHGLPHEFMSSAMQLPELMRSSQWDDMNELRKRYLACLEGL